MKILSHEPLKTPVVFIIFNRPDLTRRVFDEIARVRPAQLFVIADGPRTPQEADKCEQTRAVIKLVDWDCEVHTSFSDKNLGGPRRISGGLDWVFSNVEEAIVLEDDCLPARTFFHFCQSLLERYRHDHRIMSISGDNYQNERNSGASYYFSKYSQTWGWASWRRAWNHFDLEMKTWKQFKENNLLRSICPDEAELQYWTEIFDRCTIHSDIHWDYAFLYACWAQNGLCVLPTRNLISNIGFRPDATHTTHVDDPMANAAIEEIDELIHPPFIVSNSDADYRDFENVFGGKDFKEQRSVRMRVNQRLRRLLKKLSPAAQREVLNGAKAHQ